MSNHGLVVAPFVPSFDKVLGGRAPWTSIPPVWGGDSMGSACPCRRWGVLVVLERLRWTVNLQLLQQAALATLVMRLPVRVATVQDFDQPGGEIQA